jgi:hypothetical protein
MSARGTDVAHLRSTVMHSKIWRAFATCALLAVVGCTAPAADKP